MFGVKLSYLFLLELLIYPLAICGKNTEEFNASEYSRALTLFTIELEQLGPDMNGEATSERFGVSSSMSRDGSRIVVCGHDGVEIENNNGGFARAFEYDSGAWVKLGSDIDGEAEGDAFGASVSMSGDGTRIIVGGHLNDEGGLNSGHARVYEFEGTIWEQLGPDINGEAPDDRLGRKCSMSDDGNRIAIGARLNDGNGVNSGYAVTFFYDGNAWQPYGGEIVGEAAGDHMLAVSLSADGFSIVVGGSKNKIGIGIEVGHARVFEYDDALDVWVQLGSDIDGKTTSFWFGWSVSMSYSGRRIVVGGNGGSQLVGNGYARAFEYDDTEDLWVQLGSDIDGEAEGDGFGGSVSMSGDGTRIVVGGQKNVGNNGLRSGHARVFQYETNVWEQIGTDLDGGETGDNYGKSVAMSGDGQRIVVAGGQSDAVNGDHSGIARAFFIPVDPLFYFSISSSYTANAAAGFVLITRTFGTETTSVRTELKDKDCGSTVTRVIASTNTDYENNEVTSTIQVSLSQMESALDDNILFNEDENAFVGGENIDQGFIKFCLESTSITLWGDSNIDMKTFRGGYSISYNIVDSFVLITSVTESEIDVTDVPLIDITLGIEAVRCSEGSETFTGFDSTASLVEGDVYYLCLKVDGGTVSNVNLNAFYSQNNNGDYDESISLVSSGIVTNPIIGYSVVGSSRQIAIPILAAFLEGIGDDLSVSLKLEGNADLEFSGSGKQKLVGTETYELVVELTKAAELGCFGSLFRIISNVFV